MQSWISVESAGSRPSSRSNEEGLLGSIVKRLVVLPALALLAAGLSACTGQTNGSAVAGPDAGTTTEQPDSTTTTRGSQGGGSPLADKDPCSLLSASAQSQLGLTNQQPHDVGSGRGCRWDMPGPTDTYIFDVQIYDKLGIKDLPDSSKIKQLADIGSHKAVQISGDGGPGSCTVILGVTDSSRVTTGLIAGTDTQKACDLAMQTATLVEPGLPRG
jgi:hypothetical protein